MKSFEMVMNCSINVVLPPNFIKSPPKNPMVKPPRAGGNNGKGSGKGKKRKQGDGNEDHIIKNTAPITKFLMKEGEIWKQDFAGKFSRDRPKWGEELMCARWQFRDECFVNSNNKLIHIGASAVPQPKRNKFKTYLTKVRRENSSPNPSA